MGSLRGSLTYRMLLAVERRLAPLRPRRALLALGRRMTPGQLCQFRTVLGALEQGQWLGTLPMAVPNVADRFALFTEALRRVHGSRPLYLEFGVYKGRTLRWWGQHLTLPAARLVGFDSFVGLPEDWRPDALRGWFAPGVMPQFDDPRVSLVVGRFEKTLPCWEPPAHDQLIVNVDCDLYFSTACVLTWLDAHLHHGMLVYFDDLLDRDDELEAVREWIGRHGSRVVPLAMARWGQHMLFEVRSGDGLRGYLAAQAPREGISYRQQAIVGPHADQARHLLPTSRHSPCHHPLSICGQ